jgi:spermidine synthase
MSSTVASEEAPVAGTGLATILLGLSIFATGFCGLVSEFVLSTVSSYILGNSVEQFSVIIALMMLMMGVAGAVQRFFPDRHLVQQFVIVEMLLALLGGFAPLAIYAAYGWMEHHFLVVLYGFVMALGFLIGFELPLVLRINSKYVKRLPSNLAVILGLDYVGGFVGALVWTRYLLRELPLTETSFVIAGFNFAIASLTFAYFAFSREGSSAEGRMRVGGRAPALVAIGLVAALLLVGYVSNRDWGDALEQRLFDHRIVFAETTRYQRIVVTHDSRRDDYRLFLNGNLQLSSVDEVVYHEQLVHPAMSVALRRDRVLILGGGDGMAAREVLEYPDVTTVTLVDLDPRMTELAATHPLFIELNGGALRDARVRRLAAQGISGSGRSPVHQAGEARGASEFRGVQVVAEVEVLNVDADRFVAALPGLWDVVLIDLPDPSSVELAKLYSREFYRRLRGVLAPGAVLALQATSPYHAKEAFLCILRTLESAGYAVLPYHDQVPSFGSWGWVLASPERDEHAALRRRVEAIESFDVETAYLTPELTRSSLVFGKGRLHSDHAGVNTLMRPVLLDLYLRQGWQAD